MKLLSKYFPELFEKYRNGDITKAPIEDFVKRVDESVRPEVITLDDGYKYSRRVGGACQESTQRVLLLRSPDMPEFAFAVFGKEKPGTRWRIRINYSIDGGEFSSRQFPVVCTCCRPHKQMIDNDLREEDQQEFERRCTKLRQEFSALVQRVCEKHGINVLFFRKASVWEKVYGELPESLSVVETNEYRPEFERLYRNEFVQENLSWLTICDTRGRNVKGRSRR